MKTWNFETHAEGNGYILIRLFGEGFSFEAVKHNNKFHSNDMLSICDRLNSDQSSYSALLKVAEEMYRVLDHAKDTRLGDVSWEAAHEALSSFEALKKTGVFKGADKANEV